MEEETGKSTLRPAEIKAQASWERLAEITSGRASLQQGLVATCKDFSNEAKAEVGESHTGLTHESVGAMTGE